MGMGGRETAIDMVGRSGQCGGLATTVFAVNAHGTTTMVTSDGTG